MGIISPKGFILSIIFWSLFLTFSYYAYLEVNNNLAKLRVHKVTLAKSLMVQINETLFNGRQEVALRLFKKYAKWNSSLEDLVKFVKRNA